MVNYAVTNSCGTVNVNYNLTVTTGCSGTPVGGSAIASVVSGCGASYTTNLSLSGNTIGCGISYQWYSSPNNSTWTPIAGATSSTYAATVNANTYYECILTCSNGGATGTSSSVYCSYSLANDICSGATALSFIPGINLGDYIATVQGDNTCATADGTSQCFTANKSVWFKFTAPVAGSYGVIVESGGTMKYPELTVLTGSCGSLTEVSCAGIDNSSGSAWESGNPPTYFPVNKYSPYSLVTKYYSEAGICNVAANQTVYALVDDYQAAGTFTLTVATLTNDNIPNGVVVANCGAAFNSSTIGATNCSNCSGTPLGGGEPATVGIQNDLDCNASTVCNGSGGSSCGNGYGSAGSAANSTYGVNGGDVGYSVENDSWYQFCVTASTTVTISFSPVASSCLPSSGHGGSSGLQITIFTGTSSNLTKVAGGYNQMGITGTFNSTFAMTAGQCCYVEVDGFAGTNCNYNLTVSMSPTCVLPVEMLNFSGVLTDNLLGKLNWTSMKEENASHYIIEKSIDGVDFTEMGTVKAKGNTNNQTSYEFYDNYPYRGINYYKLSGADKNGKINFLGYVTISNKSSLPLLNLYPNPAQNNLTLSFKNFATPIVSYELYDAQGVLIQTENINLKEGNLDYNLDLKGLDKGFYFVKVNNGEDVLKKTFIKVD